MPRDLKEGVALLEGSIGDDAERLKLVLRAIDEGLKNVLGDSGARAICYYFERFTGLKMEEVLERPEAFAAFLKGVFGAGFRIVEASILEVLFRKFGLRAFDVEEALRPLRDHTLLTSPTKDLTS